LHNGEFIYQKKSENNINTCFKSSDCIAHGSPPTKSFESSRLSIEIFKFDVCRRDTCMLGFREAQENKKFGKLTDGRAALRPKGSAEGITKAVATPRSARNAKTNRGAAIVV
jgi:hypothetical protein